MSLRSVIEALRLSRSLIRKREAGAIKKGRENINEETTKMRIDIFKTQSVFGFEQ
jgi:hypothetical protein